MPFVPVRGRRLAYDDAGTGFPLLFGHSYLWDRFMWNGAVRALSGRFRCIRADLWSHGASDPLPAGPFSLDVLADDHLALMDSLGIDRFGVVGLSVGGMWAPRLALKRPERVAAMVLMNTAAGGEPLLPKIRYNGMLKIVEIAQGVPSVIREAVQKFFFSPETLRDRPDLSEAFKRSLAAIPAKNVPGVVTLGRTIFCRDSLLDRLGSISCPTLVVAGEKDRSRPPHEAEALARAIPGARAAVVPGAGHISVLEKEAEILSLIGDFLDGCRLTDVRRKTENLRR
jgi:pimeloyl-ACP methyl ester carboxylesterase